MDCSPSLKTTAAKSPFAHLYKQKGANWKTEFRKNLNRRIRDCRNNLVDKFRNMGVDERRIFFDRLAQEELLENYKMRLTAQELNEAIEDYEKLREELLQQEFEDICFAEAQLIEEEIAHYFDSNDVYCPRCQKSAIIFPDRMSFSCQRCIYTIKFACDAPSPSELLKAFEIVFSAHADNGCVQQPQVLIENNQMLFMCSDCAFSSRLF